MIAATVQTDPQPRQMTNEVDSAPSSSAPDPSVAIAAGLAHDLRNALFGIVTTLEALEATITDRTRVAPLLRALRRQVDPVRNIADDLTAYANGSQTDAVAVPFGSALAAAIEGSSPQATMRGVALEMASDSVVTAQVRMDRRTCTRALQHVLDYLVEHTTPPGPVLISTSVGGSGAQTPATIEVQIASPTTSIAAEDVPRVIEPFYPRRLGGDGLRLTTARRVVESHGGSLRAMTPEGGADGITFVLRFPVAGT